MTRRGRLLLAQAALACGLVLHAAVASAQSGHAAGRARIEACIAGAARHHGVNAAVLHAILRVESGLDPRAIGRNADGSVDLGIGQVNSRHLPVLARHGVLPGHLMDGCVGAYVAAWHLSTLIAAHGNSWTTVARYHSATPALNRRYQVLLGNELLAAGAIAGRRTPVPARPRAATPLRAASRRLGEAGAGAVVLDEARVQPLPRSQQDIVRIVLQHR